MDVLYCVWGAEFLLRYPYNFCSTSPWEFFSGVHTVSEGKTCVLTSIKSDILVHKFTVILFQRRNVFK